MQDDLDRFTQVDFRRFKAFDSFSLNMRKFNILAGPNNAGKSTVLTAFRILSAGLKRAYSKRAELVPNSSHFGHRVDLASISVAEENIFYNYDTSEPAEIIFKLSNGNSLSLYFPEPEVCFLVPTTNGPDCLTPSMFKTHFRCPVSFVPILGPVEHRERLFERDAARLALANYGAARNFRNIWHHLPDGFDEFRALLTTTWPGMSISKPEVDTTHSRPILNMWCEEQRRPRELYWSGFGFQVWCQMLTYMVKSRGSSIFLIDEPDIYLHSDLQRRLVATLRYLGPDILIATHSIEMLAEADTEDIVLVDKAHKKAKRLKSSFDRGAVFRALGSNANPTLTQVAKTRRVIFFEGGDFSIVSRLARKLGFDRFASCDNFAVVQVDGFNPDRVRSLKAGMEATLGESVAAAIVLDRDYRSSGECESIVAKCNLFCKLCFILESKEIENLLLVPPAIDRAILARIADRVRRGGEAIEYEPKTLQIIEEFATQQRPDIVSGYLSANRRFHRSSGTDERILDATMTRQFEGRWVALEDRLSMLPGKETLAFVNRRHSDCARVNATTTSIVDAMRVSEISLEARRLIDALNNFANAP